MQTTQHAEKLNRQRKMLLLMPLLILPFITLFFWAIGGGKNKETDGTNKSGSGLNTQLPDAKIKSENGYDKLSFYQQASKDSIKQLQEKKADPYWLQFNNKKDSALAADKLRLLPADHELYNPLPDNAVDVDANEAKVYNKLNQLNKALANSRRSNTANKEVQNPYNGAKAPIYDERVEQLEAMMNRMKADKKEDPEIAQLNQMLDKIAAIQHPELVRDTLLQQDQSQSINGHSLQVRKKDKRVPLSTLQAINAVSNVSPITSSNAFFGESSSLLTPDTNDANVFGAMIAATQTIVSGATVKLSLLQEVTVQGKTIPRGSYLYGTATLRNERLMITISSIRFGNSILPVSLTVYDMDGLAGIYVPGSITANATKQSADRIANGVGTSMFNSSLGAQAASASIETAKALLSKKVKLVKVTLPAGYQLLLKDMH